MVGLIAAFLKLSGKAWSRKQQQLASRGGTRSYRVLEAARGTSIRYAMHDILEARASDER